MQIEAREPEETASNSVSLSIDRFAKLGFGTPLEWKTFSSDPTVTGGTDGDMQHFSYDGPDIAKPVLNHESNRRDGRTHDECDERDGAEEKNIYLAREYLPNTPPSHSPSNTRVRKRRSDHADSKPDSTSKRCKYNDKVTVLASCTGGSVASHESSARIATEQMNMTNKGGTKLTTSQKEIGAVSLGEKNSFYSGKGRKRRHSGIDDIKTKIRRTSEC